MTTAAPTIERPTVDGIPALLARLAEADRRLADLHAEHDRLLADCLDLARAAGREKVLP